MAVKSLNKIFSATEVLSGGVYCPGLCLAAPINIRTIAIFIDIGADINIDVVLAVLLSSNLIKHFYRG